MRLLVALGVVLMLATAGCLNDDGSLDGEESMAEPVGAPRPGADQPPANEGEQRAPAPAEPEPPVPEEIVREYQFLGAVDGFGEVVEGRCQFSDWCVAIPVQVERALIAAVDLTWRTALSDFDLYLLRDGEIVAQDASHNPGAAAASLTANLEVGAYEILLVPYEAVRDSVIVHAEFAAA